MGFTLHIQLLGELSLNYGAVPLTTISTPRLQSLLTYLLLHRQAPQSRQHLAFLLWPDLREARARANLRKQLYQLQRALPEAERFLIADAQTLQWRLDSAFSLDVAEFEQAASQTHSVADLQRAVNLYGGDLLPGCYDEWIVPEREHLKQILIETLERLLQFAADEGDYQAAIKHAHRLLQIDPLHEEIHRRLIQLHSLNHDRAAALRAYHACASILQRELGVEPGSATRETYERLLDLDATAIVPLEASFPLVGREREWSQLQAAWRITCQGYPQLVILMGETGTGKTRLADELFRRLNRQGISTAVAHCYAAEGTLAYAPVTAWLRARPVSKLEVVWLSEVARLLPEILTQHPELPAPGPLNEAWQRQRLHEALARALLGNGEPLLLWIEDLQWCDRDTLEWLHYLLRFDSQARLLMLSTLRPEEVMNDQPVTALLSALRHERKLIEIAVGPLDTTGTQQLAAYVAGHHLDSARTACLYHETEGNPLFIVETLRASSECAEANALPPTVQAVIATRLAQLSPQTHELMELAAAVGREFTFEILRQANDTNEETLIRGLDELWQRRIIREIGASAYDFSHGKLREVAYASLSTARRRLLHRRVAEALVVIHVNNVDRVSAQVAVHYQAAGLLEQAISHYRRAAQIAQQVSANQDAITYLSRAIELMPNSADVERYELLLARERIYALQGAREAQACDLAALHELAAALNEPSRRAQVAVERGNYWRDISDFSAAIAAAQQALSWIALARRCATDAESTDAESGEDAEQQITALIRLEIDARYLWGMTLDFQGNYAEACRQHQQAWLLARARGLRREEARCLYGLSRSASDTASCKDHLEASLPIHREVGDQTGESLCLNQLGYYLSIMGDYEAAAAYYEQSLRLAHQNGFRPCESNVLFRLGLLHNQIGDYVRSRSYLEQAIAIARKDNDPRSVAQSLYNLSWAERGLARPETARGYAQEALAICQAIGDRNGEAAAWRNLGATLINLQEWVEGTVAFQQMLVVCQTLADQDGVIDALAGLASTLLAQSDAAQAQACVQEILDDHDRRGSWQGTYVDMFPVYWTCYQVLKANRDPRTGRILETAYTLLQERAIKIATESRRRSFLENVVEHREIVRAWTSSHKP
ncbi:Transcriptional regulatory protein MoaR1 [Thermoflexales bacterium]|nr:Transcriptional regulatory protein MoaR1 [Thermoflexales bacterium]